MGRWFNPYSLWLGTKLSTRSDNIIYAEDFLKEAIERANASVQEKNPKLKNKDNVTKLWCWYNYETAVRNAAEKYSRL